MASFCYRICLQECISL